jgi:hypothetical protein
MSTHQKGFGTLEVVIVAIGIVLLGFVGWRVWDAQNQPKDAANTAPSASSTQEKSTGSAAVTLAKDATYTVTTPALPDGWKSSECSGNTLLLPPTKASVRCEGEDSGYAGVYLGTLDSFGGYKDCSHEAAKNAESKQFDWFVSYACQQQTVDAKTVVKETTVYSEKNAFTGAGTSVTYTYLLAGDMVVRLSFNGSDANNDNAHLASLETLAQSIAIR